MEISKFKRPHTCQKSFYFATPYHIDSDLIVEVMLTIVKRKLSTSVATIQDIVVRDYGRKVFYWKAWMTK
jgi:phage-related protein